MEKNRYGHILTENFQEAVGAWIKNYCWIMTNILTKKDSI